MSENTALGAATEKAKTYRMKFDAMKHQGMKKGKKPLPWFN